MNKGNLLVIDDEPMIVENIKYMLKDYADEIFTAYSGAEGLRLFDENTIHCIICDICMPSMNGVEVIEAIRQRDQKVPFIFFTGHGNLELMKEAAKYGAFDFLDKPEMDGLLNVIRLGLEKGFNRNDESAQDWEAIETEFAKMLKEI
jgi:DNA-binding NtrC family response regulator